MIMQNILLIFLSFILFSCSEQEMAEIEYKSGKYSSGGREKISKRPYVDSAEVVSRKLERSASVKNSSNSSSIKKKEIEDFKDHGAMKNYQEVHVFEKKKIDHDNYPENDTLFGKNIKEDDIINQDVLQPKIDAKTHHAKDRFIIVRSGDDIKTIADEYNISIDVIAKENELKTPYHLEVGQILKLPASQSLGEKTFESPKAMKITKAVELHSKSSDFIKPVEGEVICSFGEETEAGSKNEGVNFSAKAGETVHAVASGIVIYASNQLEDYGNLVIIKHDNAIVTTYAHLQQISVQKGSKVTVGDIIGKVGSTGNVSSPQLHFAVRKGKDVVDPISYLPK